MKFSILQITLIIAAQCSAFVTQPTFSRRSTLVLNAKKRTQKAQRPNSKAAASKPPSPVDLSQPAVELEPEPEGGEEIQAVSTMPGSRMKNMGEAPEVKTKDGGTAYKFWLTAQAGGPLIKEINTRVLKDASKKAEFPGFRKVSRRECYNILLLKQSVLNPKALNTLVSNFQRVKFLHLPCHKSEVLLSKKA